MDEVDWLISAMWWSTRRRLRCTTVDRALRYADASLYVTESSSERSEALPLLLVSSSWQPLCVLFDL